MATFADGNTTGFAADSPEKADSSSSEECDWSDEDADESLARALAANAYLQGIPGCILTAVVSTTCSAGCLHFVDN